MNDVILLVRLPREARDKLKKYVKQINTEMSPYVRELLLTDLRKKGIIK